MKRLLLTLSALALSAPAPAAVQDIAPPLKRKPAATAAAPAKPAPAPAAQQQAARSGSIQQYQAALTAAAAESGDAELDAALIKVMSGLLAAGRCGDAAGLATRDGRKELASRAQQLCK